MEPVIRTKDEVKPEGEQERWNVEQALDHCFPGWRDYPALFAAFAKIQAAFRRAAVKWASSTGHAPGRAVQVPHKGADNQRITAKAVLPQVRAIGVIQNIVPEILSRQIAEANEIFSRQIAEINAALQFAQRQMHGPHLIDEEEEGQASEEEEG